MPVIPQYYRQQRLSGTAGNVITNVSTDNRQLAELGNTLTEIGMRSEQQRLQAQYHDQLNNAKLQAAKMFDEYNDNLDINDTSKYLENLEKVQAQYDSIKFTNSDAQNDFGQYLETLKYTQKKIISDKQRQVDAKLFKEHFNNTVNVSKDLYAKAETEGEAALIASEWLHSLYGMKQSDNGLEKIENWENHLFSSDEERELTAQAWLKTANIQRTKEQGFQMAMQMSLDEGEKYILSLELPTDDKRELLSDLKVENLSKERKLKEQNEILVNDVIGKMSSGTSLSEISSLIKQTIGLSNIQKEELMKVAINSEKVWNEKSENPFTVTQNYEQLTQDMFDMQDNKIKTHQELRDRWLKDGTPQYGINYFTMLDNMIDEGKSDVLPRTHPLVEDYTKQVDAMFLNMSKDKKSIPIELMPQYTEARYRIEQLAQRLIPEGKFSELKNELDLIVNPIKESQAKGFLYELFHPFSQPSIKEMKDMGLSGSLKSMNEQYRLLKTQDKLGQRGSKPSSIPQIKNDDDYKKLPSGTQFIDPRGQLRTKP